MHTCKCTGWGYQEYKGNTGIEAGEAKLVAQHRSLPGVKSPQYLACFSQIMRWEWADGWRWGVKYFGETWAEPGPDTSCRAAAQSGCISVWSVFEQERDFLEVAIPHRLTHVGLFYTKPGSQYPCVCQTVQHAVDERHLTAFIALWGTVYFNESKVKIWIDGGGGSSNFNAHT